MQTHRKFGDFLRFLSLFQAFFHFFLMKMMFQGHFQPKKDARALLTYFKNDLTRLPVLLTEHEKCTHFSNYVYTNSYAEEWYEEFENSGPEILTLWMMLCKHFCVKWLGAPPSILLEILEINPPI